MKIVVVFLTLAVLGFRAVEASTLSFSDMAVPTAPRPDIFANTLNYSFDAGSDVFLVTGSASTLRTGGTTTHGFQSGIDQDPIFTNAPSRGVVNIQASIDNNGVLAPGGTLSISGGIPISSSNLHSGLNWSNRNTVGSLLTGSLTALVFEPAGTANDVFLMFSVTGGAAAVGKFSNGDLGFGAIGSTGIIALHGLENFTGSWGTSFTDSGNADIASVPVPTTGLMLISLCSVLGLPRTFRRFVRITRSRV